MLGNTELATVDLPQGHPLHVELKAIRKAAQSASRLTQQLLAFKPHLFEPFYTTRRESGGSGLGLATCHRPNLRLCAMLGFLPSPEVEAVLLQTGAAFVPKPFERAALLEAVRGRRSDSAITACQGAGEKGDTQSLRKLCDS